MIEMIDSGLEFVVLCYISDSNAVSSYLPNVEAIGPPYSSVKSESRPVVSEQSVNGRPGPETDYGTTNLSAL